MTFEQALKIEGFLQDAPVNIYDEILTDDTEHFRIVILSKHIKETFEDYYLANEFSLKLIKDETGYKG